MPPIVAQSGVPVAGCAADQRNPVTIPDRGSLREVRGKHQFHLRAHRTLGATVILTGTHQDQLPKRAKSIKMPRSRLAGSLAQYATFSSASLSDMDIALPNLPE